jgi:hypothetical protein
MIVHGDRDPRSLARDTMEALRRGEEVTWVGRRRPIAAAIAELDRLGSASEYMIQGPSPTHDGRGVVVWLAPASDSKPTRVYVRRHRPGQSVTETQVDVLVGDDMKRR